MATRSTIGVLNSDGTVEAVYCHWDGYPEHNGRILVNHYNTESKVRELLSYGGISCLREQIGVQRPFSLWDLDPERHNAADYEHMCTFYARDRGDTDELTRSRQFGCPARWIREFGQDYNYLFIDGVWHMNQNSCDQDGQAVFNRLVVVNDQLCVSIGPSRLDRVNST